MNYTLHYEKLCNRAKCRILSGYKEKHHIIPRCLGGTDARENIAELTPEEHFVAHQLLVKIYPTNGRLVYAARAMTIGSRTHTRNNKLYGWIRRRYITECKKRLGDKNPSYGRRWYHDPETLVEGKFLDNDIPPGWIKGRHTGFVRIEKSCPRCGEVICQRRDVCSNTTRLNRFIRSFGFNTSVLGTFNFYNEYDRVVETLNADYNKHNLSVEDMKVKYNISNNETMRMILKSIGISRRDFSSAAKNFCNKTR